MTFPIGDKRLKLAVYMRRSKGESGTTADQLEQLENFIAPLEKKRFIYKVDRNIQGRDIKKKRQGVKFFDKGDIYNEGDGFSGYNVAGRPVFMELLERLRNGEYDGVMAVSMDRYARNYGALSRYAYDLWGEDNPPKLFYGFAEKMGLGEGGQKGIISEKVLSSLMEWGGLAKSLEIKKAETKRTGTIVDTGYLLGSRPEWVGKTYRGKTSKGVKYRDAWEAIKTGQGPNAIARAAGKFAKDGQPERSFVRNWKNRLLAYNRLGVLDGWLDAVEAVNKFILDYGAYPKSSINSTEVKNLLRSTAGYFAYPAGVALIDGDSDELTFVMFPNPLEVGIQKLSEVKDATIYPEFEVTRRPITQDDVAKLDVFQTQPRAAKNQ